MSLTSLPTELIEQITSHLDLASARSNRLVCSSLRQQTLHHFKDRFFRQRTLKWTKESLDTLLVIVAHPDFGNALQNLIVDATPRHSIQLWKTRKRISEAQAIFGHANTTPTMSGIEEQYAADKKEAEDLATFFNETRYDQKCLKAVFEKLGRLESTVFMYEGMDRKYGKFGRRYCESSQHEMSRPFVSTMSAIASSNISVKTISIHDVDNHGAVSIGRLESLAPALKSFDGAFSKLEVLKLSLRDWRYPESGFELDTYRTPFVIRFLAKARNVKTLDLSCYSSLDDNLFADMAQHCKFTNLETCKLSLFRINNAWDLTAFLAPSSTSLKHLTLNHLMLRDEHVTWPDLLRDLIASTQVLRNLQQLKLVNLFTRLGCKVTFDEHETTWLETCRSRDWREDLIMRLDGVVGERGMSPAWALGAASYPFRGLRT